MSVIFPVDTDPQHWIVLFYFRQENEHYLFRVLNADHVTLEECEAYQADGTAFRPKDTKDLHLENCIAINYFDKGFGYDSDKNKSFGSVFVDGF